MKLKICLLLIFGIFGLYGKAQYQIPLYAPGNTAGLLNNNDHSVLLVAGQNVIGISQDNQHTVYFGLVAPIAVNITDAELISKSGSRLMQNYPNPYRQITTIPFELARQTKVKLSVTDITGRPLKILLNQVMPPGIHNIEFNGDLLMPGIYLYQLQVEGKVLVKPMVTTK